jgi:hypothetical protein
LVAGEVREIWVEREGAECCGSIMRQKGDWMGMKEKRSARQIKREE